jgi:hypothetical protein
MVTVRMATTSGNPATQSGLALRFGTHRPGVMVVSHERSELFLMNSIEKGYGYVARPWIDLDHHQLPIRYFHQPSISKSLDYLADQNVAAIIKSHHTEPFSLIFLTISSNAS